MLFEDKPSVLAKTSVLIVDDEPESLSAMLHVLRRYVGTTEGAENGDTALQACGETPFDIIITDLRMPGMDGVELIRRLHAIQPRQKIVVISGIEDCARLIDLINLGVDRFLAKPVTPERLVEQITEISWACYTREVVETIRSEMQEQNDELSWENEKLRARIADLEQKLREAGAA